MKSIDELHDRFSENPKLIQKWKAAVVRRVKQYARNVAKASPFLDKPAKRMFGARPDRDGHTLTIFGTSPNAGRIKGFSAPVNEWMAVNRYFRILHHGKWRTIHKVQEVSRSAGVPLRDVPYFGTSERPDRFYGVKKGKITLAYGKTKSNLALPVYARDSFADWLMENHRDELEDLIIECGMDVLF